MVDADKIRDVPQRKDWGEVTRYVKKIWLQLDQVKGRTVESPGRRMTEGEADISDSGEVGDSRVCAERIKAASCPKDVG